MLHDWNRLLIRNWIRFIDIDSQVNRLLVLVAALSLYDLHLVLEAEN